MSESPPQFRLVDYRKVHPDSRGSTKHYLVYCGDVCCGSIYRWRGTAEEQWHWSVNGWVFYEYDGHVGQCATGGDGMAETLEAAMLAWKENWHKHSPDLNAIRVEHERCSRLPEPVKDQYLHYLMSVERDRQNVKIAKAEDS